MLGEIYAKVRLGDHAGVFGRQTIRQAWYLPDIVRFYNKLNQSMIGPRDVRGMQNIHYEAATCQGRFMDDTLHAYTGYIWGARQINSQQLRERFCGAGSDDMWQPQQHNPPDGLSSG